MAGPADGSVVRRLHELPGGRFAPDEPVVALTFDDGPGPSTPAVAAALAELDTRATFFVVGSASAEAPEQLAALTSAGHTVAGHSWSHPRGELLDDAQIVDETERTAALIREHTGKPATFVRPTYRKADAERLASVLDGRGYTVVTWSVDPRDWAATDPVALAHDVLDHLHSGAIVVLHDGGPSRDTTVAALPLIVHGARLAGYRFVAL